MAQTPNSPDRDIIRDLSDELIYLSAESDATEVLMTYDVSDIQDKLHHSVTMIGIGTTAMELYCHNCTSAIGATLLVGIGSLYARKNKIVKNRAEQTIQRITRERTRFYIERDDNSI